VASDAEWRQIYQAQSRSQSSLLPESVDDFIAEDNPVRVIDVFVDALGAEFIGVLRRA